MNKEKFFYVLAIMMFSGVLLTGCADTGSSTDVKTNASTGQVQVGDNGDVRVYEAEGNYTAPSGAEVVDVKISMSGNLVSDVIITSPTKNPLSQKFQGLFREGIKTMIIGKPLSDFAHVDRVNGSSLTGIGFNEALDKIKAKANS